MKINPVHPWQYTQAKPKPFMGSCSACANGETQLVYPLLDPGVFVYSSFPYVSSSLCAHHMFLWVQEKFAHLMQALLNHQEPTGYTPSNEFVEKVNRLHEKFDSDDNVVY